MKRDTQHAHTHTHYASHGNVHGYGHGHTHVTDSSVTHNHVHTHIVVRDVCYACRAALVDAVYRTDADTGERYGFCNDACARTFQRDTHVSFAHDGGNNGTL